MEQRVHEKFKKELRKQVDDATSVVELYKAPQHAFANVIKNPPHTHTDLNVAVVAAPCHGFGDVIFATKFARYLKYGLNSKVGGYTPNVTIITPTTEMFKKLGVDDIELVHLHGNKAQCRRLRNYNRPKNLKKFDLIFIAPLTVDFNIDYSDVRGLLKESTPFNTLFLSEYQDDLDKEFDFPTGIDGGRYGLLFDGAKPSKKLKDIGGWPYVLGYLAKGVGYRNCLLDFGRMVVAKYSDRKTLQIVLPKWATEQLATSPTFKKFAKEHYPNITLITDEQTLVVAESEESSRELVLRGDIFPVPREDMLSLIKYSQPDILMTGDQSITDAIDCCPKKTIWYQTVPWKKDFATALATALPQKYLKKSTTSCGSLKAIEWDAPKSNFKRKYDFRKLAKGKLNGLFILASEANEKGSVVHTYLKQLGKSRAKGPLLELLD